MRRHGSIEISGTRYPILGAISLIETDINPSQIAFASGADQDIHGAVIEFRRAGAPGSTPEIHRRIARIGFSDFVADWHYAKKMHGFAVIASNESILRAVTFRETVLSCATRLLRFCKKRKFGIAIVSADPALLKFASHLTHQYIKPGPEHSYTYSP